MSARYMQPLRILVQNCFLGFMIWLGYDFFRFVQAILTDASSSSLARPTGIDGFLPIAGLLGAASWIKNGSINAIHPAATIIFITVISVSLLLRRSFCSWICPVATISEAAWKGGFRCMRRNLKLPPWGDRIARSIKYLLLFFFVYSICFTMSPDALIRFIQSDYYRLADVRLMDFFLQISPVAAGIIALLIVLSLLLRNPFCRYLCPYGALLGLVAIASPLRVTRNLDRCVSCGVCSKVCPTYIDVMHKPSVGSPECIGCWRCISYCRFNEALSMRFVRRIAVPGVIFAFLVVAGFWGGSLFGKISGHWYSSITLEEYARLLGK